MGSQAAQVMAERSGGELWKPAAVGVRALKVAPVHALSPREQLRAAVVDRLQKDTTELLERMRQFLDERGRPGVATFSQVFSVSSIAQDLWKLPRQVPEARAQLARTLGLLADAEEAGLVRALLAEVRQAFVDFEQSAAGHDFRERYQGLLFTCEELRVLPIILGYDVGPMVGELGRLGLKDQRDCGRSMLLDSRVLAVMPPSAEEIQGQVWVSGVSASQLATIVIQMRQLNPLLSNRQALRLMERILFNGEGACRKSLGRAETDRLLEWSRQLLRLQGVERLPV